MAATRPTRRGQRGSAAVEFALAVPMLLSVLVDPAVTVTRTPTRTTVAVCGAARGIPLPVAVTVSSPTERYTTVSREFANSEWLTGANPRVVGADG